MITTMRKSHIYTYACVNAFFVQLSPSWENYWFVSAISVIIHIKMSSVFIASKNYSLVHIFSSSLFNDVQLLMQCHMTFLIHLADCTFHNSLGSMRTFLECPRNCWGFFQDFSSAMFCLWGEEMLSKFPLSYFICKYVFNTAVLGIHRN